MSGFFRDEASQQIVESAEWFRGDEKATNGTGIPMASLTETLTVGPRGNILLQDFNLIDHIARFGRERIPARVVHAKGGGALGYFESTADISNITRAKVFSLGRKTPVAVRFSGGFGEEGAPDTVRNFMGFAIKFYTEEGIWDLVGSNTPIFFLREPILFPGLNHCVRKNPVTHLLDANMQWDFFTLRPETTHQIMFQYSDRGIPDGFRHMHGFGSHAFKFVNKDLKGTYVKFHLRTDQGVKNLMPEEAIKIKSEDLDYNIRDLYNAIARKEFPSWTFCIQVMTFEQAKTFRWNAFDLTKVWPYEDYPLQEVGKLVLNENPTNHFNQIEQIAFCPTNMPPGIEPSPDLVLQLRLHSYVDTQRYRLGANFEQLPINHSKRGPTHTYDRDGPMSYRMPDVGPNYYPNSFGGPKISPRGMQSSFQLSGNVTRYDRSNVDNYSQATMFWYKCLDNAHRQRLVNNIASELTFAVKFIQQRAVNNFSQVHPSFGIRLQKRLDELAAAE